jgi:bifunctional non-homologous end joining protein LigD
LHPKAYPQSQGPERHRSLDDWISEIKFDGYRLIAAVSDGTVRLLTRNGLDWTTRLPSLAREIARLPVRSAMLDGELVSLRPDGVSSFPGLQTALKAGSDDKLIFYGTCQRL